MEIISWFRVLTGLGFLFGGLVIFGLEVFGLFRFQYVLNRMHAAAIGDTFGIGVCLIGLMILNGWNIVSLKFALVILFFWLASPVSSHLIARLEVTTNKELSKYVEIEETEQKDRM